MVSPLNIFCWFGYIAWVGFAGYQMAMLNLPEGLFADILVAVVALAGCLVWFLVLNHFFPDEPEETDSESAATDL